MSVQVFFGLPVGLAPSNSCSIHFVTQSLSSFRSTCLFCCSTEIISSHPSLSLNSLLRVLCFTLTSHIHLMILIDARWSATAFSFPTGQISLPCNILLYTQQLYNITLTMNDISLLVNNGNNCLYLFHPIWILVPQLYEHLHVLSTCHLNNETYPWIPVKEENF